MNASYMYWFFNRFVSSFLLPPLNVMLLAMFGVLILKQKPRLGRALIILTILATMLLSMPIVSSILLARFEAGSQNHPESCREAQAIVVLGGGVNLLPNEFDTHTISTPSLDRVRYGAWLHRLTKKPILVTGGNPEDPTHPEGELMRDALVREFNVPVAWVENASNNTRQNAQFSRQILAQHHVDTICLVTHSWHIPRARRAFEKAGFQVIPAGINWHRVNNVGVIDFLPNAASLNDSSHLFHELIGLLWYRLR